MPAKLTEKQIEALRTVERESSVLNMHTATKNSLIQRELIHFLEDKEFPGKSIGAWWLTNAGRAALDTINAPIPEPPLDPEDTKPLPPIAPTGQEIDDAVQDGFEAWWRNYPQATEAPQRVDPVSERLNGPQQAIQPLPACSTCDKGSEWCFRRDCPHVPCQARDWYKRAYRYQRADTRYNIHVMDVNIDDVPIDVMIAARESAMERATPPVEPFILRAWYKKLLDARDALAHVPLHDNAAFNDAVLDFKCIKARYMKLEERWQLRQAAGARR